MTQEHFDIAFWAQVVGVVLTLGGYMALSCTSQLTRNWKINTAFGITFGLLILGIATYTFKHFPPYLSVALDFVWNLFRGDASLLGWQEKLTVIGLYTDAVCLAVLVFYSGGTRHTTESIFTPIFIILPALGASFLRPMQNGHWHIVWLTLLTVIFYIANYYCASTVEIEKGKENKHRHCVLGMVTVCIIHSAWVPLVL